MVAFLENLYVSYTQADFATRFVSTIIAFLIVVSLILFTWIMISRTIKNRRERKEKIFKQRFESLLTDLVFEGTLNKDDDYQVKINYIKEQTTTSLGRRTFIKILMELHGNLTGESAVFLENIYKDLGFKKYAIQKVKKGKWFEKCYAFMELSEFDEKDTADLILKFTDVKHKTLRDEAQFALIRLLGIPGLKFVPKISTIMSDWQQLRILEQLKRMHRDDIPSFIPWLKNENFSVVVFALKLIAFFNQVDAVEETKKLLHHEHDKVKLNTLRTLNRLGTDEITPFIISNYDKLGTPELKIEAIKTLMELQNPKDKDFLFERLKEDIYEVVLFSALTLVKLGLKKELVFASGHLNNFNRKIVIHALDERI